MFYAIPVTVSVEWPLTPQIPGQHLFRQPALTVHSTGAESHLLDTITCLTEAAVPGPLVTDKETEAQGDLFNSAQWRGSQGSIICSLTRVGNTDPPEIPLGGFLYNLNTQLGP